MQVRLPVTAGGPDRRTVGREDRDLAVGVINIPLDDIAAGVDQGGGLILLVVSPRFP